MHSQNEDLFFSKWADLSWGFRLLLGLLVFVSVRILIAYTFDLSPVCLSGWKSPSIGSQGACSHNGGVDRSASENALAFSLIVATLFSFVPNMVVAVAQSLEVPKAKRAEEKEVFNYSILTPQDSTCKIQEGNLESEAVIQPVVTDKEKQEMLLENEVRAEASRRYILQELEKSRHYELLEQKKKTNRKR